MSKKAEATNRPIEILPEEVESISFHVTALPDSLRISVDGIYVSTEKARAVRRLFQEAWKTGRAVTLFLEASTK